MMEVRLTDAVVGWQKGELVSSLSSAVAWPILLQSGQSLTHQTSTVSKRQTNLQVFSFHPLGWLQGTNSRHINNQSEGKNTRTYFRMTFVKSVLNVHSLRLLGVFACLQPICCVRFINSFSGDDLKQQSRVIMIQMSFSICQCHNPYSKV